MNKNPILFIADVNNNILKSGGIVKAINGYTDTIVLITPQPISIGTYISVSMMPNNANYNRFEQYLYPTTEKAKDYVDETDALYQTILGWNVFKTDIESIALAEFSSFRSGSISMSFAIQQINASSNCVTYKGVFGSDNLLPTTDQMLGDFYECKDFEYSIVSGTHTYVFSKGMYVYWNGSRWVKDRLVQLGSIDPRSIPVEPNHAVGTSFDDDETTKLEAILTQVVINEQDIDVLQEETADILDGTTIVKKAEQDKNGNDIVTTYETKSDATSKLSLKADKTYVDSQDQALDDKIDLLDERVEDLEIANMIKSYTYNPTTHVITFTYYDNTTTSFDLPLESAIVSASYDDTTQDITFVLQSGATLVVPLDDLVSGLASETWVNTYFIPKTSIVDNLTTDDATKVSSAKQVKVLQDTKEFLANKATDFSVVDDTKYPTTKAVSERLLNLPIVELNNHTLKEVFEDGNMLSNNTFDTNLNNWSVTNNVAWANGYAYVIFDSSLSLINQVINMTSGNSYYTRFQYNSDSADENGRIFYQVGDVALTFKPNVYVEWVNLSFISSPTSNLTFFAIGSPQGKMQFRLDNVYHIDLTYLGISSLTVSKMDYWFSVYQALQVSSANALFTLYAPKQQEAWLTPTLTGATTTYLKYRKDTLGSVIVEGNITVTTAGTNLTLPTGYRPLFGYTVGILTFNTDGTVVSSATGTQTLSVRFTGGA